MNRIYTENEIANKIQARREAKLKKQQKPWEVVVEQLTPGTVVQVPRFMGAHPTKHDGPYQERQCEFTITHLSPNGANSAIFHTGVFTTGLKYKDSHDSLAVEHTQNGLGEEFYIPPREIAMDVSYIEKIVRQGTGRLKFLDEFPAKPYGEMVKAYGPWLYNYNINLRNNYVFRFGAYVTLNHILGKRLPGNRFVFDFEAMWESLSKETFIGKVYADYRGDDGLEKIIIDIYGSKKRIDRWVSQNYARFLRNPAKAQEDSQRADAEFYRRLDEKDEDNEFFDEGQYHRTLTHLARDLNGEDADGILRVGGPKRRLRDPESPTPGEYVQYSEDNPPHSD